MKSWKYWIKIMKRVGKSSPLLQYVTFSAVFHNVQETKTCFPACDRKPALTQLDRCAHIQWKCGLFSLGSYVCLYCPEIFCVKGLVLSAHMYVMVFQVQHPSQSEIFSLCLYTSKQLDWIFHFVRLCWSFKTITYIQAEWTRPLTQNISGQYSGIDAFSLWRRPCLVFPFKIMNCF